MRRCKLVIACLALLAILSLPKPAHAQHGVILSGGGPVQRSMGGVGTGTALDTLSGTFWNPAALSALECNEMTFGAEAMLIRTELSSSVAANNFGPGIPPLGLAGATQGDNGTLLLPNIGLTHHLDDSPLTLGFGVITAAGFMTNYPASFTNPILTPPPPVGLGAGRVLADMQVLQFVPSLAVRVTDRLSIGASPIVNFANLRASPVFVSPPDDANRDFAFTYRNGTHTHWHWGAGFQVGAYYVGPEGWNFGASVKSPQWFETFRFNTVDEIGLPRVDTARFDLPWIGSVGASYEGFEDWLLAADVRYIDYRNAPGFSGRGYLPTGAVRGLGWDSQIAVALGAQYRVSERLRVRTGYSYNNSPQDNDVAFFNLASPTIIEHVVYTGASWDMTDALTLSFAYAHGFENSVEGPITLPVGPVPGTQVRSRVSADGWVLGVAMKY